jgi:hypothetical protein
MYLRKINNNFHGIALQVISARPITVDADLDTPQFPLSLIFSFSI